MKSLFLIPRGMFSRMGSVLHQTILFAGCFLFLIPGSRAADRYWVAAGASNWNNTANWSASSGGAGGATVPGLADRAIFDNNGSGNCSIDITVSINRIVVNATYSGAINQGTNPIGISGTSTFAGGTFTGGSGNISFTGAYTNSGTAFTSTSGILEFNGNAAFTGGSFVHNNGTVKINGISGGITLSGISPSFYILELVGEGRTYNFTSTGNIPVSSALNISGTLFCTINTGIFDVSGDINITNTATGGGGNAMININGAGTQNFNGGTSAGVGALPQLTINSTGTVNLAGFPSVGNGFTYTSGTINAGSSTFCFTRASTGAYAITGSVSLNNVLFISNTALTASIAAGTTVTVNDLGITGTANLTLNTGSLNVNGNISLTNTATGGGGTATINITGAANQLLDGSAIVENQSRLPVMNINKPAGILTLSGNISFPANIIYTAGAIDPSTSTSYIVKSNTITGSFSVYDLVIDGSANITVTPSAGTTLTATHNLSLASGAFNININTGTIAVQGDILDNNSGTAGGGTGTLLINGTGTQNITSTGVTDQGMLPGVTISKTAGTLVFPPLTTVRGNWTYTSGLLDVASNNSTIVFANTLTITGTHSLNNVTFEGNGAHNYTIATGTVLTVSGTLSETGASNVNINTPIAMATAIEAKGDIQINNSGGGGGGTGLILIDGGGAQTIASTVAAGLGRLPHMTIQKATGTLTLTGIISESRNWTYNSGIVDAVSNASTVVFGGNNLNITSDGMSFYNATVAANTSTMINNLSALGDLTISGTGILSAAANSISLAGDWNNRGTAGFTEGTGTVNLNGSALQAVTSAGGENFYNLTVNNSGAGIQLINGISVRNALNMTQGNIDLNGQAVVLGISAANRGTLVYSSGTMINAGSFTRWFNTSTMPYGSVAGLFPVGTATDYRPFYVSAPVSGPTTGGTLSLSYTDATTNTAVSIPDAAFTVLVRKDLSWALSAGSGLAGGTYELDARGTGLGLVGDINDLRLTLLNSMAGNAGVNAGTVTNPQVNRIGLSLANLNNSFYIGSVNPVSTTLPVSLVSFTATIEKEKVRLDWETAAEVNNDHFTIQRSANGKNWEDIIEIRGSGNTSTNSYYTAEDESPLPGTSYYRLKQTDMDGKSVLSFIRQINLVQQTIRIYPNPATDYIAIDGLPNADKSKIELFNAIGQRLNVPVSNQGNLITLNVSRINSGVFYIRISQGGSGETRTIEIRK